MVLAPTAANSHSAVTCSSPSSRGAVTTLKTPSWSAKSWWKRTYYTSIHIEKYEIEARDTKLGPKKSRAIFPTWNERSFLRNLDESGVIESAQQSSLATFGRQSNAQGRDRRSLRKNFCARSVKRLATSRRFALLSAGNRRHHRGREDLSAAKVRRRTNATKPSKARTIQSWKRTSPTRSRIAPTSVEALERLRRSNLMADLHDERTKKALLVKGTESTRIFGKDHHA